MIQDSFKITHTGSYTLDPPPTQDSSHHQRIMTFLVGNSYKPSFATVWVGGRSKLHLIHKFWVETTNSCLFENEVLDHKLFFNKLHSQVALGRRLWARILLGRRWSSAVLDFGIIEVTPAETPRWMRKRICSSSVVFMSMFTSRYGSTLEC